MVVSEAVVISSGLAAVLQFHFVLIMW